MLGGKIGILLIVYFLLANKPFAKTLRIFETCISVINSLWGKLVSSLEFPIKFDERFKVT